jgi:phthiocerol/phenolphthiocerol synthesis type-I polyketide synthase E
VSGTGRVAIIGMGGAFPGACSIGEYWEHIRLGEMCITHWTARDGEIGSLGMLEGTDRFDAALFGITPADAVALDPQQRLFLELCWHALEDAGIDPFRTQDDVSVYASCSPPPPGETADPGTSLADRYQYMLATSPDFLATRVSYRLNLRGESMLIQTGCSSSLVAVHMACASLLSGQSDVAIAGGVSIADDQTRGYLHQEGMITSPTGHCRPFDAEADGAVPGSGGGVVVLKTMERAMEDGDHIHAVIIGSAINNDGSMKASFMAPSARGQAEVIAAALAVADISASSVGLLEAHGTATALGDQVEVRALRQAFEAMGGGVSTTALGSLKGAFGHMDRASGIAGLIKATLAVANGVLPPASGTTTPNPELPLVDSPFYFLNRAQPWKSPDPRRAGVSSFGVGGTNAHVLIENAPDRRPTEPSSGPYVLPVSAASEDSLREARQQLAAHLVQGGDDLATVAGTLQTRRAQLSHRFFVVGSDRAKLAALLREKKPGCQVGPLPLVFVFSGHGMQEPRGAQRLARFNGAFAKAMDECRDVLIDSLGFDVFELFADGDPDPRWRRMEVAQPALLAYQYALVQMWRSLGVTPDRLVGHSMGEITAALVAGVFTLEAALDIVAKRGALLDASGPGAMLSVPLSESEVLSGMPPELDIAAVNASEVVVVAGPQTEIEAYERTLLERGLSVRRLAINSAAHSRAIDPCLDAFHEHMSSFTLREPSLSLVSAVTGRPARGELSDPAYWVRHLRQPVRFRDALSSALDDGGAVVHIGFGHGMRALVELDHGASSNVVIVPSVSEQGREADEVLGALGEIWATGQDVEWTALPSRSLQHARLPLYPFDHRREWPRPRNGARTVEQAGGRVSDPGRWLYQNSIVHDEGGTVGLNPASPRRWLILGTNPLATELAAALEPIGHVLEPTHTGLSQGDATDIVDLRFSTEESADVDWHALFSDLCTLLRDVARGQVALRIWFVHRGNEQPGSPILAALTAFERVAPQEIQGLSWTTVDVSGVAADEVARRLTAELNCSPTSSRVYLRSDGRWSEKLVSASPMLRSRELRPGGTYVITGGFGRVGKALATAIAKETGAPHLVLLGRTASQRLGDPVVMELKAARASVECIGVDLTEPRAFHRVLEELVERRGRIDGIVHAAGFTDRARFPFLDDCDPGMLAQIADAKVTAASVLEETIQPGDIDFVLLCSSLSTTFGGLRYGPYVAANAQLNAIAERRHVAGDRAWLSLCWEAWLEEGVERTEVEYDPRAWALTSEEGREVFFRALALPGPIVTVSTVDPETRFRLVASAMRSDEGTDGASLSPRLEGREAAAMAVREAVAEVIGELPNRDDQDLRELGADSLSLLRLAGAISRRTGGRLRPRDVLTHPTLGRLTALAADSVMATRAASSDDTPPLRVSTPRDHYPTTTLQRRWLQMARHEFGHVESSVRINGVIDAARMVRALTAVQMRHSGLRTRFPVYGGEAAQVLEARPKPVTMVDVDGGRTTEDVLAPFVTEQYDFEQDVPLRILLVRESEASTVLHMHVHHILFDGTSSSVFFDDLATTYEDDRALAPAPYSYVDFSLWQDEYVRTREFVRMREYWQRHFERSPGPLKVESDILGLEDDLSGDLVRSSLSAKHVARIEALAVRNDATAFTVLVTAFGLLLAEITGQSDIVIGTTAAGRPLPDMTGIVGVFVNPLPLRLQIDPERAFPELLAAVRERLVDFHHHQAYWLEDLVQHVDPFVGLGQNETFHAYILFQNYWRARRTFGTLSYAQTQLISSHKLMRDVELIVDVVDDGWSIELWYRRRKYSRDRAAAWLLRYLEIVDEILVSQGPVRP